MHNTPDGIFMGMYGMITTSGTVKSGNIIHMMIP